MFAPYNVSSSIFSESAFMIYVLIFFPASLGAFLKYLSVFGTHKHIRNCVHTHIHMHFCLAWTKDCTIRFPYICFFHSLFSFVFSVIGTLIDIMYCLCQRSNREFRTLMFSVNTVECLYI